jgi:hypothetical protein
MIIVHHTNAICSFAGAKLKSAMLPHWRRPRSMLLVGNYQAWTGDLPETREEPVVHPAKDPRRLARARVRTGLAAGGRWIRTSGSARDRSRRAAVQKTLGVARQPFEQAQLVIEFRARRRIAVRQIQASDEQAADGRLDVAAMRIIRSPGGLRRVSTGSAPRARIATPFQLFCPARPRLTDTRWAGPLFARICPSRRLNKATIFC